MKIDVSMVGDVVNLHSRDARWATDLRCSLDVTGVVDLLERAARELRGGNGTGATAAAAEAFARLALFHQTRSR